MGKAEQQFEHLTDAQIEHYGDRTSGEGPNQNGLVIDQAIETHLAACDGCRIRVLEFHRSRFGLMSHPSSSAPSPSGSRSQGDPDSSRKNDTDSSFSPTNLDLLYLGRSDEHRPTPDCPTADALRDLAAGLSSADSPRLIQHAAQCSHCGPILRAYTEDFSDDLSPEDQALLSQLKSSTPAWQKQMAQQMAAAASVPATSNTRPSLAPEQSAPENARVAQPPSALFESPSTKEARVVQPGSPDSPVLAGRGGQPPSAVRFRLPSLKWILAPVALAATAVIAFFIWNAQRETPEKVERLLAQAYTEQRTMEMRIAGAEWGPVRENRGAENSSSSHSDSWREAAKIVRNHISSQQSAWKRASAEADMLAGNYDVAAEMLSEALQANPESVPLLLDSAISFFEIGKREDSRQDIDRSITIFNEILKNHPENREALFDLGTAYTEIKAWPQAVTVWRHYLRLDPDGPWAAEAKQELALAEAQIHQ